MKRFACAFEIVGILVLVAIPVYSQDASSSQVLGSVQHGNTTIVFERSNADLNLEQLSAFGDLASSNPALTAKLARNPSLVNNTGFVSKYPALRQFLEKYPSAAEDIVPIPATT